MKKLTFLVTLLLVTTISFGQKKEKIKGSKIITHTINDLESFTNIEVEDNLEVFLVKGDKPSLEIEADDNLHDAINFSVAGNTLRVFALKDVISAKKFSIRINYTENLKLVVAKGETKINALNDLQADNITIKNYDKSKSFLNVQSEYFTLILNDKAEAELNVKAQNTTLELSKSAELKALIASPDLKIDMYEKSFAHIEGDAENVKLRIDNSTNLEAKKLTTKSLDVTLEGYASAEVNVTNNITITASGKSKLDLYGEPKIEIIKFTNSTTLFKKEF